MVQSFDKEAFLRCGCVYIQLLNERFGVFVTLA